MENKYYTPKIEEFYIGFEYELNNIDSNWKSYGWSKEIVNEEFPYTTAKDYLGLYRVKHLEQSDLIELGWEFDSIVEGDYFYTLGNMIEGNYFLTTQDYKYFYINPGAGVKKDETFVGTIKNKSEMRKLMEMLNIKKF